MLSNILIRRVPKTAVVVGSAWISRIIVALSQVVSIRMLTDGLGAENYAIFALLTSMSGWFLLFDFGLGTSLQNFISEQRAKDVSYKNYIATTLALLAIAFLLIIGIIVEYSSNIGSILLNNFNFQHTQNKKEYFLLTSTLLLATTFGNIAYKIWYAQQKGYLSNIFPAVASILSLSGILLVSYSTVSNKLYWSLFIFLAPGAILSIICLLIIIVTQRLNFLMIEFLLVKDIMKRSVHFFYFSLTAAIVLQVDYIVLSQNVGTLDIVKYNITTKIFLLASFIYNAVLTAIWPGLTERYINKDWYGISRQIKRTLGFGMIFMIVSILFILFFINTILSVLSPSNNIIITKGLIILFGCYYIVRVWTDTFSVVLQSMSKMKTFWIWVPIQAFLSVFCQWILVQDNGLYGIIIGLLISFILTVAWALPMHVFKELKRLRGQNINEL